jgi:sugar phosphate isomerase/epimerase
MTNPTRRQLLQYSLGAGAALAFGAGAARAIEPVRRTGAPHLRLSLAAYSFRQRLAVKKDRSQDMTLDDFINLAAGYPLDAVELTQYYFPKTTPDYLAHLKGHCTRLGLDVSGTAVGNNFCVPDSAGLKKQLAMVKAWVEHTSRLGGKTIRIFAGNVKRGDSEDKARERCIAAIEEACAYAGKYGIYLALENHGGITSTPDQLLKIVKAVKSDWFGVNLDTGNFRTADPYADLARIAPYAVTVQVKTEIRRKGAKKMEDADLAKFIEILRAVNYRGYVALEYEAKEDAKTAVPRALKELKKLVG